MAVVVFVALPIVLAVMLAGSLQANAQDEQGQTLRVATKPLEPFVSIDGEPLRGFGVDYWNEVATRLDVTTEWVEYETVDEIVAAVDSSEADVAIAGISIAAEREQIIDFSQPYYNSGLQIVTQ